MVNKGQGSPSQMFVFHAATHDQIEKDGYTLIEQSTQLVLLKIGIN